MSFGLKMVNATGWQFLSVVFQIVSQLVVLAVLARYLDPADFGLVAYANIVLMLASVLTQGSIRPAVVQKMGVTPIYLRVAFTLSIGLGLLCLILIYLFSAYIGYLFNNQQIPDILIASSFSLLFNSAAIVSEALLEKQLRFRELMVSSIASYLLGYSLLGIVLAVRGYGAWAIVYGTIAQSVLRAGFVFLMIRHPVRPSFQIVEILNIGRFAFGSILLWLCNYVALQADNFIVGRWLGEKSLGIYSMAFTAMDMPRRFLSSVIEKVLFPVLSTTQEEEARFQKIAISSVGAINLIMLPVSCILILMADEIVNVVLGDKWQDVVLPLQILLIQIPMRACVRTSDMILAAKAILFRNLPRKLFYALSVITLVWIGQRWHITGVATGVTIAVGINFFVSMDIALKNIALPWSRFIAMLAPGVLVAIATLVPVFLLKYAVGTYLPPLVLLIVTGIIFISTIITSLLYIPKIYGEPGKLILDITGKALSGKNRHLDKLYSDVQRRYSYR